MRCTERLVPRPFQTFGASKRHGGLFVYFMHLLRFTHSIHTTTGLQYGFHKFLGCERALLESGLRGLTPPSGLLFSHLPITKGSSRHQAGSFSQSTGSVSHRMSSCNHCRNAWRRSKKSSSHRKPLDPAERTLAAAGRRLAAGEGFLRRQQEFYDPVHWTVVPRAPDRHLSQVTSQS